MKQSLGLLEVSGLALAISCADVMAKAASITLVGLEKTNGSGWTVIKIIGDVASVQQPFPPVSVSLTSEMDWWLTKSFPDPGTGSCRIALSSSLNQRPTPYQPYRMKRYL